MLLDVYVFSSCKHVLFLLVLSPLCDIRLRAKWFSALSEERVNIYICIYTYIYIYFIFLFVFFFFFFLSEFMIAVA